jgi:CRP-like cAMP-binding protein
MEISPKEKQLPMSKENYTEFFLKNPLFSGLSEKSLKALYAISQDIFLKEDECLMKEGEEAHDIFFILEGNLKVVKHDRDTQIYHIINHLYPGDSVGELTLFDKARRSASIYAVTDVHLLKIASKDLHKLSREREDISTIYLELSKRTSQKLRETTDIAAMALKKQVEEYKNRANIGQIFIYSIVILSLFVYSASPLKYVLTLVSNSAYISVPMIILISGVAFLLIYSTRLPLYVFGFTMVNWKRSLFEGFLFTLPLLALLVLAKWIAIHFFQTYHSARLFEPFSFLSEPTIYDWILINLVYCLFVPVQELMARGVLQGLLEKFLIGRWRVITSIFVSNLIFSAGHIFLSETIAITVFIAGLYLGWLYSRTHNLLGVILAHCLLGVWGFSVVGVVLPK